MAIGGHENPIMGKDEWLTPPEITQVLGPFDLDPCSPINRPWATAREHYTVLDDGLSMPWHGFVWCNPPYGNHVGKWLAKLADHGSGIALVFARTETQQFFDTVWRRASGVLFLEGRLRFYHVTGQPADGNAGAPSCLVAYGDEAVNRLWVSGLLGALVRSWGPTI